MVPTLGASFEGRYKIDRELGAGGMATVYLADDLRHKRRVALKVLKPELAAVLGADRFVQEITTTAALQHPNILPLFDSGNADGFLYYVMPFIDGETLRSRLDRETQLGIDEAVRITVAVADALDYAHRHGVIHRDIKPENILLHEGRPVVADFGIALALSAAAGGRMTETGLSLGTPHYMSPEQATAEKEISARSDVYSLASVLYEMLTGDPPHMGASAQQIIMKIVTEDAAPVTKLRKAVPPNVAAAVDQALEKLPADRFESAKAFAVALENPAFRREGSSMNTALPYAGRRDPWRLVLGTIAFLAIAAAIWTTTRNRVSKTEEISRFALALPTGQELQTPGGVRVAFAPDGRSFVYTGSGPNGPQLWLRRLNEIDAVPIPGTDGATSPTFSPDGTEIGFNTLSPFAVRAVALATGQSRTVTASVSGGGLAWASNGYMYVDGGGGIAEVRPDGSGYRMLMPLDTLKGESGVAWPSVLPNARGLLYRIRRGAESTSDYTVGVLDLRSGKHKELFHGLSAFYTTTGHLVWISADGTVHGQRFDLDRLEPRGESVALFGGLAVGGFGAVDVASSSRGDLLFVKGEARSSIGELVWVKRDGSTSKVDSSEERGIVTRLSISPDGKNVAMEILRPASGSELTRIWVKRLDGGPTHLVTSELSNSRHPLWSPDGQYIFYTSLGGQSVMRRRVDGSGSVEQILRGPRGVTSMTISPDGKTLLLRAFGANENRGGDIMQFRLGVDSAPTPLLTSQASEDEPTISPDGKWLAYSSDESGQWEVYVRPFPNVDSRKIQVSTAGGEVPMWSPRGDELFYLSRPSRDVMSARFTSAETFDVLRVDRLFNTGGLAYSAREHMFQPVSDGSRFLAMDIGYQDQGASGNRIVFIQNFASELKRRLP